MKKRKVIAVISVLLVVTLLLVAIPSVAKYVTNKKMQSELTSQNFYFSSNFLKSDEEPTYEIHGNTVTFSVRKYIDSLRVNDTDINFTVLAEGGTVDKTNGSLTEALPSADITLTYAFASDELQKEITVSVTGTGKFTQTLKAKFVFIKPDSLTYKIEDQADRDYAELYIYTGNTAQNVEISWKNAELFIDETNDYIFGKLNSNKDAVSAIAIPADTTVKIVFFKKDITKDYTCGITKSTGTITIN
ncbi:MAG: hypothetical protein ACI4U6_02480 [Acutalibacteraceae bacterium]